MRQLAAFGRQVEFKLILVTREAMLFHADGQEALAGCVRLMASDTFHILDVIHVPRDLHQSDMQFMGEIEAGVFHQFAGIRLCHPLDVGCIDAGHERQSEIRMIRTEIMNIGDIRFRMFCLDVAMAHDTFVGSLHRDGAEVLVIEMAFRAARFLEYALVQMRGGEVLPDLHVAAEAGFVSNGTERGFMAFAALGSKRTMSW